MQNNYPCPKCGKSVSPKDQHCPNCGEAFYVESNTIKTQVYRKCPNCNSMVSQTAKFCNTCGEKFSNSEEVQETKNNVGVFLLIFGLILLAIGAFAFQYFDPNQGIVQDAINHFSGTATPYATGKVDPVTRYQDYRLYHSLGIAGMVIGGGLAIFGIVNIINNTKKQSVD